MKKLLSVLLISCLLVSCCAAAAGEDAAPFDFTGVEIAPMQAAPSGKLVTVKEESYAISEAQDSVTVSGNMIAVRSRGLTMLLDLPDAYVCFTQDYIASIKSYVMMSDPEPLQNFMVEASSHYYLLDQYTFNESHIDSLEQDRACLLIGNLSYLSDADQNEFAAMFGEANGLTSEGLFKTETAVWMRYSGAVNVYVTIVGSEYLVYYIGDAAYEDAEEVLEALSVFG